MEERVRVPIFKKEKAPKIDDKARKEKIERYILDILENEDTAKVD